MNTLQIATRIEKSLGYKKGKGDIIMKEIIENISIALSNGEKVTIDGLGTFSSKHVNERIVFCDNDMKINMYSGKKGFDPNDNTMYLPETTRVLFKPSAKLKNEINRRYEQRRRING